MVRFRPCAELALTPSTASLTFRPLGLQQTLKCPFYPCFFSQYIGPPSPRKPSRSLAVWPPLFPASAAPHLATPSEPARCPPPSLLGVPGNPARQPLQACSPPPPRQVASPPRLLAASVQAGSPPPPRQVDSPHSGRSLDLARRRTGHRSNRGRWLSIEGE